MTAPLHACNLCRDYPEVIGSTSGQVLLRHFCAHDLALVTISGTREQAIGWWNNSNPEQRRAA